MGQLQHTSSNLSTDKAVSYQMGRFRSGAFSTEGEARKKDSFLKPEIKERTENDYEQTNKDALKIVAQSPTKIEEPAQQKSSVDGTVLEFDAISVTSEIYVQEGTITVQLPRELFPQDIYFGFPISLAFIEDSGFRKPQITTRQINKTDDQIRLEEEMDALIQSL